MRVFASVFVLLGLTAGLVAAQQSGGGASGGATGGSAGGGSTGGATGGGTTGAGGGRLPTGGNFPGNPTPRQPSPGIQRPIFISGKVVIDDGTPIPMNASVQSVCSGIARTVAHVDLKGYFSFIWGQSNAAVIADASESGNPAGIGGDMGDMPGMGGMGNGVRNIGSVTTDGGMGSGNIPTLMPAINACSLRAQLPGFRSDEVQMVNRTSGDNPDVGIIVLHRIGPPPGAAVSATSLMAPKDAKKAYENGMKALEKNKTVDAAKEFEKAVAVYPKYADAWVSLAKIRVQQQSPGPARDALLKAVEADNKLATAYMELGMLAANESQWADAAQYLDTALRLDPQHFPQAWFVDAAANFNLKRWDMAEKSAREAMKVDPKHTNPRANLLLGLALLQKQQYKEAAGELRSYLQYQPDAKEKDTLQQQLTEIDRYLSAQPEGNTQP
jgi:tetratricopeptide (TPR) repeat protein